MKKHLLSLAAAMAVAMLAFTSCGKNDTGANSTGGQTVAVTGVTLSQTTATLLTTDLPLTLTATVAPSNATNKNVSWASSDATVATVNDGVVTPVAAGTATITVTTQDGNKSATCAVTVGASNVAVTGVTLSQTTATLAITDPPLTLVATVAPNNATDKTVKWESGNPAVATVMSNGMVTAIAVGSTTIVATTNDGGKSATCAVTVTPDPLTWDAGVVIGGLKWATRNVDAPHTFAATPQSAGMFYQWNSATGWSASGTLVSSPAGATWNDAWTGNGITTDWVSTNDPCPTGWRMPTITEIATLIGAGGKWTTTPVGGYLFGSAPNTVFFPAVGSRINPSGTLSGTGGGNGYYWSATTSNPTSGYYLYVYGLAAVSSLTVPRYSGFSVRCVAQ